MYYLVNIYNEYDFEKLRYFDKNVHKSNRIVINIKNDIIFEEEIIPVNLDGFDVYIEGNNHTLNNININEEEINAKDYSAIIEKVDNLYVKNLKFNNCYIYGGVKCAVLAADVSDKVIFENISMQNTMVNSEAFCGGLVARCKELSITNSSISASVYGHDIVGGVVGMTDKYIDKNCIYDIDGIAFGKAISAEAGYYERKLTKNN